MARGRTGGAARKYESKSTGAAEEGRQESHLGATASGRRVGQKATECAEIRGDLQGMVYFALSQSAGRRSREKRPLRRSRRGY